MYPLYQAMDDFCGNDSRVRRLKEHIEDNIQRWESINQESLEKKDEKPEEGKMKNWVMIWWWFSMQKYIDHFIGSSCRSYAYFPFEAGKTNLYL